MPIDASFVRSVATATALVCASSASGGCLFGTSTDDDPEAQAEGVLDPHSGERIATRPLSSCADGLSAAEIEETIAITFDFEISAHEMVACGGLVFGIVRALVDGIVELAQNPNASTLPEGYTFDGQGTYYVQPSTFDDLRMEVRFYLGRDYSFGAQGDLVTTNLFDMSSYLIDPVAEVTIDNSSGWPVIEIEITHQGPGPMVELLGLGTDPPSPIHVTESTLQQAQAHLGDMGIEAIIFFRDHPGVSTIEYDVQSPPMLARSVLTGAAMNLAMVNADGWRDDLGQDLDVDVWTVQYADGVGALDGDIDFTVRGGPFDYVSRFHYDGSGWPLIELSCAP